MDRTWTDDEGRTWTVRPREGKLVFLHGGRRRVATPARAGDLESLDDAELRELFEDAGSVEAEEAAAGGGPASPSAMGRESAPHADPSDQGSSGSS